MLRMDASRGILTNGLGHTVLGHTTWLNLQQLSELKRIEKGPEWPPDPIQNPLIESTEGHTLLLIGEEGTQVPKAANTKELQGETGLHFQVTPPPELGAPVTQMPPLALSLANSPLCSQLLIIQR